MRACCTSCRAYRSRLASVHINHRAPALLLSRRHPRQQQTRRQLHVQAMGGRKGAQQMQMIQQAAPQPRMPPQRRGLAWFVAIPGLVLLIFMVLRMMKKLAGRGSVNNAMSRGLMKGEKGTNAGEPYYKNIMKHVNTIQMEELSDAQILAARKRRSKERDMVTKVDIDKLELPDNHPFAVKKKAMITVGAPGLRCRLIQAYHTIDGKLRLQISKDEEELIKKRLEVKRGLPLQDLTGRRGLPDDPRMQANAEMQAQEALLDAQAEKAREARFARQVAERQRQMQQSPGQQPT